MFNDLYKLKADKACSDGNLADKAELALNLDGAAGSDPSGDQMDKFEELASILRETAARLQERVSRLVAALEKASAGLPKDAWLAQGNPADRLQQILRKESAELTGKAAAAQPGAAGRYFSAVDRAYADLLGKSRPRQGNPAREDQQNIGNLAFDLMKKTAENLFGREPCPASAFDKAFAALYGKSGLAQQNPAEELQQKLRKDASELTKRAAVAQLGAVGCHFSPFDKAFPDPFEKTGAVQGKPAQDDQRIVNLVSDLRAKAAARLSGRADLPTSAFDKAFSGLHEKARPAQRKPAEDQQQILRKEYAELTGKAAAAQFGVAGCYHSVFDRADADLSVKTGPLHGNPAREDQRNTGKLFSDLMKNAAANFYGRAGCPASAFDKAIADLPENGWIARTDPAEEARQKLRRNEMELAEKLGITRHADMKFPFPEIRDAGGFAGGLKDAGAARNTRNDLYYLLMGKAGRNLNN